MDLATEFERVIVGAEADPRPFYAELREREPVYRTPFGFTYVTRYDLGQAIMRADNDWSVSAANASTPPAHHEGFAFDVMARMLLTMDGVDHTRQRRLVSTVFTGRAAERLRGEVERSVADQLRAIEGRTEIDLFTDFAQRLPTQVILDVLGIGHEHFDTVVGVADSLIAMHEPTAGHDVVDAANNAFQRAANLFVEIANERRRQPGTDVMTSLVQVADGSDRLTNDELVALVVILVVAGHETTANTLCTGVLHLLENPEALEQLRADRSLLPTAVEELLRFDAATRNSVARYALRDLEVGGVTIQKGERLFVSLHAANHDPAEFADPLRLDITRDPNRHMGFGGGAHYCLGAALARMELAVAIDALLDAYPTIELAGPPSWRRSFIIRGLDSLPLRLRR